MKKKFDLKERTSKFGEEIIEFVRILNSNPINKPLISQIVRSATSIGANYMEADCAESKKDFKHKIGICKKESSETQHWLKMIKFANPVLKEKINYLDKEAHELLLIFASIIRSCDKKN